MSAVRGAVRYRGVACALALLALAAPGPARAQRLYDPAADASGQIRAALAAARADGKLVLLDFGADWCLDCHVLDRLFEDPAVAPYLAAHYHVVRVDVGKFDRNLDIVERYDSPIKGGVPAAVVLTGAGKVLVSTSDGALESARNMTASEIRRLLERWAHLEH